MTQKSRAPIEQLRAQLRAESDTHWARSRLALKEHPRTCRECGTVDSDETSVAWAKPNLCAQCAEVQA